MADAGFGLALGLERGGEFTASTGGFEPFAFGGNLGRGKPAGDFGDARDVNLGHKKTATGSSRWRLEIC